MLLCLVVAFDVGILNPFGFVWDSLEVQDKASWGGRKYLDFHGQDRNTHSSMD